MVDVDPFESSPETFSPPHRTNFLGENEVRVVTQESQNDISLPSITGESQLQVLSFLGAEVCQDRLNTRTIRVGHCII